MKPEDDVVITKALLLGFNIALEGIGWDNKPWYNLQKPDGDWVLQEGLPKAFYSMTIAARYALVLAGARPYAKNPRTSPRANRRSHD